MPAQRCASGGCSSGKGTGKRRAEHSRPRGLVNVTKLRRRVAFSEIHLLAAVVMKPLMDEAFTSAYTPG
jgi:hypothetical protein